MNRFTALARKTKTVLNRIDLSEAEKLKYHYHISARGADSDDEHDDEERSRKMSVSWSQKRSKVKVGSAGRKFSFVFSRRRGITLILCSALVRCFLQSVRLAGCLEKLLASAVGVQNVAVSGPKRRIPLPLSVQLQSLRGYECLLPTTDRPSIVFIFFCFVEFREVSHCTQTRTPTWISWIPAPRWFGLWSKCSVFFFTQIRTDYPNPDARPSSSFLGRLYREGQKLFVKSSRILCVRQSADYLGVENVPLTHFLSSFLRAQQKVDPPRLQNRRALYYFAGDVERSGTGRHGFQDRHPCRSPNEDHLAWSAQLPVGWKTKNKSVFELA